MLQPTKSVIKDYNKRTLKHACTLHIITKMTPIFLMYIT